MGSGDRGHDRDVARGGVQVRYEAAGTRAAGGYAGGVQASRRKVSLWRGAPLAGRPCAPSGCDAHGADTSTLGTFYVCQFHVKTQTGYMPESSPDSVRSDAGGARSSLAGGVVGPSGRAFWPSWGARGCRLLRGDGRSIRRLCGCRLSCFLDLTSFSFAHFSHGQGGSCLLRTRRAGTNEDFWMGRQGQKDGRTNERGARSRDAEGKKLGTDQEAKAKKRGRQPGRRMRGGQLKKKLKKDNGETERGGKGEKGGMSCFLWSMFYPVSFPFWVSHVFSLLLWQRAP